ncbi:hypothetical protein A4A49_17309 [Nicotiana attenuata]|uniref:Uncharacterized protein n=1 Tax=Nicotiana attenuata TaxID=49451 RepID=A0A314KXG5_NICAT|nr:hypothetical protein A4A49_17309 [Nicotiana attenuata]
MSETGRRGERAGNTRETVDSNEGGQEEYGGQGSNSNIRRRRRSLPPKRGSITKKILEDVWGSVSSPRTPPSQANS